MRLSNIAKFVDVSSCEYLDVQFEFFHEVHKCLAYSTEDEKVECEQCNNCHFKQLQLMKQKCNRLEHKLKRMK